jgi:serine/threonine protein kinase
VIGSRYRLVKTLHTGGFGRVWQAHDQRLHEDVAVKEVWLPSAISAAERTERLVRAEREARNAVRLRHHPNIVTVRDVVTEDGVPWIVMRLVTGHSLAEDLAAAGPLSPAQVMYVADCLLKALGAAHSAGIVHRDVKPANVMFTETGEVLLTDFGIAVHDADTTLTGTGMLIGSVDYIAPERIQGQDSKPVGDLFSLGVTLYQAVTGTSPFHRDTVAASLAAILFQEPPPPSCPAGLATLIMRLLAKDPRQRPTLPLTRGLLAALSVESAPARNPSVPVRARPTPIRSAPDRSAPGRSPQRRSPAGQPAPTRVAPVRAGSPPRSQPRPATRVLERQPVRRPTRRRPRLPVAVLVVLGLVGAYTAWGRSASGAEIGDCVYHGQQDWRLEPCAVPPPWQDTADYQVLQRLEGTPAGCEATPGWARGDHAVVLPGTPPVTLCLAPVR